MGVSRQEAKELIDGYFETYPQVKEYMDKSIQVARENGYVETIFHRKRFLPDINSRNGIHSTREALKWIFDSKEGEVSPLYECGDNNHLLVVVLDTVL